MIKLIKEEWTYQTLAEQRGMLVAFTLQAMLFGYIFPAYAMHCLEMAFLRAHWRLENSKLVLSAQVGRGLQKKRRIALHFSLEFVFIVVLVVFYVWEYHHSGLLARERIIRSVSVMLITLPYYGILGGGKAVDGLKVLPVLWIFPIVACNTWKSVKPLVLYDFLIRLDIYEIVGFTFIVWLGSFGLEMFTDEVILELPFFKRKMQKRYNGM